MNLQLQAAFLLWFYIWGDLQDYSNLHTSSFDIIIDDILHKNDTGDLQFPSPVQNI